MILPIDPAVQLHLERAVEQCGLSRTDVTATYEDMLQSEQILVKSKSLTDEQLRCLSAVEGASPYPIITFENAELTKRSYELKHRQERADAREWLRARGLLTSLPSYDPKAESVSTFARRIEAYCEIEPGSILTLHELGILTFRKEWMEQGLKRPPSKAGNDRFTCLMRALSASNLEEHGIRVGFVGNEYVAPDKRP